MAQHRVPADLAAFIRSDAFPCVGAKSALALGRIEAIEAGRIEDPSHDADIHAALVDFGARDRGETALRSFVCVFAAGPLLSETAFEAALWRRLQALHDIDTQQGVGWDGAVSNDPASTRFSMSIGGMAHFVVGLHPGASRAARAFHRPLMVFNPHAQFQRLRADGRYQAIQAIVRQREMARAGGLNPMLGDFGGDACAWGDAPQYSGRDVGPDWVCPLKVRT